MPAFRYIWGVERPKDKIRRHTINITVAAPTARAEAEQEFEEARRSYQTRLARIDADVRAEERQLEIVSLSTPRGRYDHKVALEVAARFGLLDEQNPEKRGPGRPPKYGPDDPRPRRPSRAKTRAGRLRARALRLRQAASSAVLPSPPQLTSVVEAGALIEATGVAPAPSDAATQAGDCVDCPVSTELQCDPAGESSPPAEPLCPDPAAVAAIHRNLAVRALRQIADNPSALTRQAQSLRSSYLHAHLQQHHVIRHWQRGQDGARMHDYDFSDPFDETKVKPEVRSACKGYGLSRHKPTFDEDNPDRGMSLADLDAWVKTVLFNGVDYPEADYEEYLNRYRDARSFYFSQRRYLERFINAERLRFEVWPYVERRLRSVEWYAMLASRGDVDSDTARALSAYDDFRLIGRLDLEAQAVFRKIVDAMTWFEGYSPSELREWAQGEMHNPMCRVHQGFPAWAFPNALRAAFADGFIVDPTPSLDYRIPSTQELIEFVNEDEELLIETQLSLMQIDYDEVSLR